MACPVEADVALRQRQHLPRRDPHLQLDEIDAGDHLGDGVFDLQPRVHLHEEELVGPVGRDDELDRARTRVVDAAGGVACGGADSGPGRGVQQRRRRLLDHLLVASLQAAFALAQMHDVAVAVGEHLDLDVPGIQHEPLEEQRVVAERRRRLAARTGKCGRKFGGVMHHPHALAAATRGRLDQDREAHLGCAGDQVIVGEARTRDARHHRHSEGRHGGLGGDLVAHRLDRGNRWADECHPGSLQRGRELRVLREESVAGVNGLRTSAAHGVEDGIDRQVALAGRAAVRSGPRRRPDDVPGVRVGIAEHRDRPNSHGTQRADHPHRDFAAVGDQNCIEEL